MVDHLKEITNWKSIPTRLLPEFKKIAIHGIKYCIIENKKVPSIYMTCDKNLNLVFLNLGQYSWDLISLQADYRTGTLVHKILHTDKNFLFSVQSRPNLIRLHYCWVLKSNQVWSWLDWKQKKNYQYANFWQDPFLNCINSSATIWEIFVQSKYVITKKNLWLRTK